MLDEIVELYDYHRWANQRILAAASALQPGDLSRDLKSSFPSVLATLAHILSAEWIWLERWNGRSPSGAPKSWDLSTWQGLTERWGEVERNQADFVRGLSTEDLQVVVDYRNTQGTPFAAPLWQLMRHVVNHSTYHRGQVVTMLRQLGAKTTSTDLVLFYRQRSPMEST